MRPLDRRLTRHLAFAVAVKLLALAVLWWFLVRDHGVDANTELTAAHLLVPVAATALANSPISTNPSGTPQ
jgi:hypothetical protein